jgi:sugar lactone lactonase YvrE
VFDSAGDLLVTNSWSSSSDTSSLRNQVLRFQGPNGATPGAALPAPGQLGAVFIPTGSGGLGRPEGLTFGPDGNLYVASFSTNTVDEYSGTTGASIGTFVSAGSGGLNGPFTIGFRPDGFLYVSSQNDGAVYRYNSTTGAFSNKVYQSPNQSGGGAMAWDANGNLYVYYAPTSPTGYVRLGVASQEAFTVSLDYPSALPITVSYATADGSAKGGTNYTAVLSGTVVFAPGETTKTILIQTIDDLNVHPTLTFTVNLSNPTGATIARGQGTGTIFDGDSTKFYVVDGTTDRTYRYGPSGNAQTSSPLGSGDTAPRGVTANATGTTEWVVDANKNVYVYSPGGTLLGSWSAGGLSSSAQLTGIATNGTDIWLVDSSADKVYKYAGAASRLSGSQTAASSFSLSVHGHSGNGNPQDLVTDGSSFWVVDGSAHMVFRYTLAGSLLGSWSIDPANAQPTGITINPNNVSDLWILDNGTDKVYQYVGAASRTSGSQNAAATFALAPGDTNPQGIADPTAADMLLTLATAPLAPNQLSALADNVIASGRIPAASPLTPRDAIFAALHREPLQRPALRAFDFLAGEAIPVPLDTPTPVADRGWAAAGVSGELKAVDLLPPLAPGSSHGFGSVHSAEDVPDGAWGDEGTTALAAATDVFSAGLWDDTAVEE